MNSERKNFQRQSEDQRREALILAALELMGQGGPTAVTVRAIAAQAGITPGLIRHYFTSKDELVRAAYFWLMDLMTRESQDVAKDVDSPTKGIGAIVLASLRPPVMEGSRIRLWTGFLHLVHAEPAMHDVHKATYHAYRNRLQALIVKLPGRADPGEARRLAIAINGVLDGLWLEGGTLPQDFAPGEIEQIGLESVAALLGLSVADLAPDGAPNKGTKP